MEVSDEGPHLVVGPKDYGVEANERWVSFVGITRCCHSLSYLREYLGVSSMDHLSLTP